MTYADVLELGRARPAKRHVMTGAAVTLAYCGAAPLLAAALVAVGAGPEPTRLATAFMIVYGAVLLIFFGGVRWGVAVMRGDGPEAQHLLGAVAPIAAALPLLMVPGYVLIKAVAIMALMLILLVDDLRATRRGGGAPDWYLGVRIPLTALIEVAFLVALAAGVKG